LSSARATTFLRFESTYAGGGWFKYHLTVMNDPFFESVYINTFELTFTNQIDRIDAPQWTNSWVDNPMSMWSMTDGITNRPWERTFFIRSSQTNFHLLLTTNRSAFMGANLTPNALNPISSGGYNVNIFAGTMIPCLSPCSPAEADGAPTNFVYDVKLLPDVEINHLLQADGQIYGLDFTWGYQSTFVLQGSSDCVHWGDLTYVWSYPPETTWESEDALNDAGPFFRLQLVANGHVGPGPNAIAAPRAAAKTVTSTPATVVDCKISNGQMIVTVSSPSGKSSQVQAFDAHGTIVQTQTAVMEGAIGTAIFDPTSLPTPVFFRIGQ